MKIYSETTVSFALKCEKLLKTIIKNELGFNVARSRFTKDKHTYPIKIVITQSAAIYGYFDPNTYQIGINYALMFSAKDDVLKNILRHEMAHYLCFINFGHQDSPHGDKFSEICLRYNWQDQVSKASIDLDLANNTIGNLESEKIINKIKALLNLAQSDNHHEAQQATIKANQLLLKHNINSLDSKDQFLYVDTVITSKRRSSKLLAIYEILTHFLVKPIFIYGQGQVAIEVTGNYDNLELAKYVASFLDAELDRLWKAQDELKGLKAKNSFFLGIAKGYELKVKSMEESFNQQDTKALLKIKNQLDEKMQMIYKNLSFSKTSRSHDQSAFSSGKKKGQKLTINSAIKNTGLKRLINWSQT